MVETNKQVRVDNWGIYFLQRLQLFFSKTDYCDLTLQFEGNVQLKVHRLVMNACTEYFAFLEQTCPALEENTIMMPTDLQADVIVPIVNFMYTGMLEYHPSIYDKLYKAAETMNIAVLTKLLEAQLNPVKSTKKKDLPHTWGGIQEFSSFIGKKTSPSEHPMSIGRKQPVWRRRQGSTGSPMTHPVSATFSNSKWASDAGEKDPLMVIDNTPKPTRFEWPDDDLPPLNMMDSGFDDISLTSKPLWTREEEQKAGSSFDEARSLAIQNRQSTSKQNSITSQDLDHDDFTKEQKVNVSQLEQEMNSSAENQGILKRKGDNSKAVSSPKRVKISDYKEETVISIKTNNPGELDHTKIVSEILKKYPDLVKKKKNIKLKIISSKNETPQIKVTTVKEKPKLQTVSPVEKTKKEIKTEPPAQPPVILKDVPHVPKRQMAEFKCTSEEGPWTCMACLGDGEAPEFVLYYLFRKHMSDLHNMEFESSLCKYCGKKCITEISMAYHLYTKHGLKPPTNINFPKCPHCPYIAVSSQKIAEHLTNHDKDEVQCINCKLGFKTQASLNGHIQITGHHNKNAISLLDCMYCMKKLQSPVSLFTHIRSQHMKEATRDGITSLKENMDVQEPATAPQVEETNASEPSQQQQKDRVKIISNVKVAMRQEEGNVANALEPATSEPETLGSISGSLATNLGLVDIVVLDDNQQYILQQPPGQTGNAEFILPELARNEDMLQGAGTDLNSTDELVMVLTDHDYQDEQHQEQTDNSNIVVLYSHPVEGQQGQFITSQGNLLVNSEGMLEIRNGAGITTTAGQILVNNDTTTTTQATDSPIESIEMIRREIEGSVDDRKENGSAVKEEAEGEAKDKDRESEETENYVTEKDAQEDEEEDDSSTLLKETEENVEKEGDSDANIDKHVEQVIINEIEDFEDNDKENSGLDMTDSSVQEEPMEVEEIGPSQTQENDVNAKGEEETQICVNEEEPSLADTETETHHEDKEGQDVPPEVSHAQQPSHETEDEEETVPNANLSSESEALNESNPLEESTDEINEEEPMEVDGMHKEEHDLGHDQNEEPEDTIPSIKNEPNQNCQITAENQPTPEEDQNLKHDYEPEDQENQDPHEDHEEILDHHDHDHIAPKSVQSQHENETSTSQFNDDDSQSSRDIPKKNHRDVNRAILEDWDDTDSQQSEKQNSVMKEAAANVNKLMDDWDEEEEDNKN